ncbi:MAG: RpiR family transcriptional regulator [Symbiobacteriaceae bacterium]|jgi:DNA-binding MurR/RpiR family transcriptional regulator|nr:RpiR family transcriptional regulator [Symbiobacteriaceae bacterium]
MATNDGDLQVRLSTALEARISGIRHDLSDKEQAVASFLLSDPKEFVSLSISALAARCRVSETVIIRLYRKLGYDGFHQFKIDIAQSLTEASVDALGDLTATDDVETIKKKVFAATRQAVEDSVGMVDSAQLAAARDALLSARRVVVAAFGGSASVGLDFVHKLLKLGVVATLQQDAHMQVMAAAVLGRGDVLMAISHSGNSRDIVETLEIARHQGAQTVLLTGFPRSPAAKAADINLYSVCRETKFQTDAMTSRIVQLAVLDTLMVSMIFADKERASASIHATSVAAARKKL